MKVANALVIFFLAGIGLGMAYPHIPKWSALTFAVLGGVAISLISDKVTR